MVLIAAILGVGAIVAAMRMNGSNNKGPESAPGVSAGQASAPATQVKAVVIRRETLEENVYTRGSILPNEEVLVTSEISAKVTAIHFQEGDRVSKGQLLVSLHDPELEAELERAGHELEFFEKKESREKQLKVRGGVSEEQYDATVRDLNTKKSEIELLKARIVKTQIRAPFSGLVGLRYVSEGAYITPGTQVALLVDASQVKLEFSVPEKYMSLVGKGSQIQFTIEGNAETFNGKVYAKEPKIEAATRSIKLRALCANHGGHLLPGAFANIEMTLNKIEDAIQVPTESIIPEMGRKKVFLGVNGLVEERTVVTGLRTATHVQVLEGLDPGDTVIVSGLLQVRTGIPITITNL